MIEIFKTVIIDGVEHSRYQVSNLGRVKCINWAFRGIEKFINQFDNGCGYLIAKIDGKNYLVHRLVAEAFLPNPQNKPEIDHIDTNRQNNIVEVDVNGVVVDDSELTNLRFATRKENHNNQITKIHYSKNNTNLGRFGSDSRSAKSVVQTDLDGNFIKLWKCMIDVEKETGIQRTCVSACCRGVYHTAGGFRFMYYDEWVKSLQTEKQTV